MLLIIFNGKTPPPPPPSLSNPVDPFLLLFSHRKESPLQSTKQITVTSVTQPRPRILSLKGPSRRSPWARGSDKWCIQMQSWNSLNGPLSFLGRDPFNQNYRFLPKLNGSVRFRREKFRKNWSTFLRWTTFPGRTDWNFG